MLQKFFGKKPKFYLELQETENAKAAAPEVAPAPEPVAVATAPTTAKPPVADKKAKKTTTKKAKKAETQAAPVAVPSPPAKVEPTEVEFATKYLINPSASRRRPGPSLNPFKEMARDAKLPINRG